jgi:hypothetical protein
LNTTKVFSLVIPVLFAFVTFPPLDVFLLTVSSWSVIFTFPPSWTCIIQWLILLDGFGSTVSFSIFTVAVFITRKVFVSILKFCSYAFDRLMCGLTILPRLSHQGRSHIPCPQVLILSAIS